MQTPNITAESMPVLQGFYAIGAWTIDELGSDPQAKQAYDYLWGQFLAHGMRSSMSTETVNLGNQLGTEPRRQAPRSTPAQKILAAIATNPKGLNDVELRSGSGLTEGRFAKTIAEMVKRNEIRQVDDRWLAGAKPASQGRGRPPGSRAGRQNGAGELRPAARKSAKSRPADAPSLNVATLNAVAAQPDSTAGQIIEYVKNVYGLTVRPNHMGIALQRHRRAGRLQFDGQTWSVPASARVAAASSGAPLPMSRTG